MTDKRKILFVTWDGEKTSYLENLFLPIFNKIQQLDDRFEFHILQFTWANDKLIQKRISTSYKLKIPIEIHKIPSSNYKKAFKLNSLSRILDNYIQKNNINFLLPRSIFPAAIVLKSKLNLPIIYDADGLALLEKFKHRTLLNPYYLFFYLTEKKILKKSDVAITRSKYAKTWLSNFHKTPLSNIFIVKNGSSSIKFFYDNNLREVVRKKYHFNEGAKVFIYVGSIGTKYGFKEIIENFTEINEKTKDCYLIILSSFKKEILKNIPNKIKTKVIIENVENNHVNAFLNASDFGYCIIKPSDFTKAVYPVKLNEYLLSGLPVIMNKNIGDVDDILNESNSICYDWETKKIDFPFLDKTFNRMHICYNAKKTVSLEFAASSYICALKTIL